ncbi:hypothetical protein NE237_015241 [Protea cynaroides]|uniref:RING-type domain-containing protein n=1 Tax=Protea cynaroides TaxID=273540 RepID=A0A9Q0KDN3_9MAGN|nr:hypothetical protein NE237_015241 [Protea cynaroides]
MPPEDTITTTSQNARKLKPNWQNSGGRHVCVASTSAVCAETIKESKEVIYWTVYPRRTLSNLSIPSLEEIILDWVSPNPTKTHVGFILIHPQRGIGTQISCFLLFCWHASYLYVREAIPRGYEVLQMTSQVVKVRKATLAACMTCPLCNKLLREATTISECLHTFCRKCIYEKLTDEETDCCPICNIDLGCVPVEKLRPDHNLNDVRAKIFPFKRRKVKAPEVVPSISLPVRRKERSLSSLVVSTPRVSAQTGLTGRRTKAVARKATALRGSSFTIDDPIKKEEDAVEDRPESSSSPETLNKIVQHKRQSSSTTELCNYQLPKKETENGVEPWTGKVDWKPLNCLVEAANRTKSFKFNSQGSVSKSEQQSASDSEVHVPKSKIKEQVNKSKVQDNKNGITAPPGSGKPRKLHGISRKRASASREQGLSVQAVLEARGIKRDRRASPIWFSLVASKDQEGVKPLPQIPSPYLRIKDGNVPVSFIQKYLMTKLDLKSETEIEITCQGKPVLPTLQLHNVLDLWLQMGSTSKRVPVSVGTSAKDFVMVLGYGLKVQPL